jgi:putative oxidoreductase
MKLGLALLRSITGVLFMGHGLQKLAGWFGGHGLDGTGQFFESMGLRPGRRHATAAGAAETVGGALLAAGLLTPLGASMITGTMATAIYKVHAKNGPWLTGNGYEYNLILLAIVFALTDLGPGEWSLDESLGSEMSGPGWALAQLGAGLAGSAAAIYMGQNYPQQDPPAATAPSPASDPASVPTPDAASSSA